MIDKTDIAAAIAKYPREAAEALLAAQAGSAKPINLDGLAKAAQILERTTEDVAAHEIERLGLGKAFVGALKARGVPIDIEEIDLKGAHFEPVAWSRFLPRAEAFRCRVLVNHAFSGSGCLVGPSLALTAWHVIATAPPDAPNPPNLPIEVALSNGDRQRASPKPVYASACTVREYDKGLPDNDAEFEGFDDVALIKLERPDGIRLGFAPLPKQASRVRSGAEIMLLHFPQGSDKGFGLGRIEKIRGITARWQHKVPTNEGSSGGPCFNTDLELVGLHQGKWSANGRFVPLERFLEDIRPLIERDIAPPTLWSLDGAPHGPLVIGRDLFFEAAAAAARPTSRTRGIRVKRLDPRQGATGLAYSLLMLERTLARNPGKHRVVRIGFEPSVGDPIDHIRRRAGLAGVTIPAAEDDGGTHIGAMTLEATMNERARLLAAQLDAAAERDDRLVWFLFENPTAGLADAERFALEAFVGAALKEPRLRLMLTGYETIPALGEEFPNAGAAEADGAPGMVVEYFGRFQRGDVEQLLHRACRDFGVSMDKAVIADHANQILQGLDAINGQYSTNDLKTVCERAVPHLDYFSKQAEAGS